MPFYLVDAVPEPDMAGLTADVPDGTSWCGNTDGVSYLILTDVEVDGLPLVELTLPDVPEWEAGETVAADDLRIYQDVVYRCVQGHTTQVGWEPPAVPALWTPARVDGDLWVQPTGAHDAYPTGAIVSHLGSLWESQIDANTTVPGSDVRWWVQVDMLSAREADLIASGAKFTAGDPTSVWNIRPGGV